jgi:voltage-gated potassium channel
MIPNPSREARQARWRGAAHIVGLSLSLTVLYLVVPLQNDWWWLGLAIGLAAVVAIAPFAVRRATAVSDAAHPVMAAVEAITMIVAMLVFGFSSVYLAINRGEGQFVGLSTKVDAVYFTVTTMSTVGYGDIHAAGQGARLAVTAQIVFDLSLLAMAVRLLVGAARRRTVPEET